MTVSKESKRRRQRRQALLGAGLFILLQAACVLCFAALCLIQDLPRLLFWLFAALAGLCGLLVIPTLVVLKQRFKEIKGGELDAAAEY